MDKALKNGNKRFDANPAHLNKINDINVLH